MSSEPGSEQPVADIAAPDSAALRIDHRGTDYRALFDASSDGLVINDLDTGIVVEANAAFCRMHGYSRDELIGMHPQAFIPAEFLPLFAQYVDAIRAGNELRLSARDRRKDGSTFPVEVSGSRFYFDGRACALGAVRDMSEREEAGLLLEQRAAERTRELSMLLDVSHSIASTLDLRPLLEVIIAQLKLAVPFTGSTILFREGDEIVVLGDHGSATGRHSSFVGLRIPLARGGAIWDELARGQPVIIDDVRVESDLSAAYRASAGRLAETSLDYIRAWMAVPMLRKEQVVGLITFAHTETAYYTARHAELATAIASHAAVAIENARLYERAQRETRRTAALARIAASMAVAGPLESVLTGLAEHVTETTRARACAVYLADGDLTTARLTGAHGLPDGYAAAIEDAMRRGKMTFRLADLDEQRPLVRHSVWQTTLAAPNFQAFQRFADQVDWDTTVIVALVSRGRKLGLLVGYYHHDQAPDREELAFLSAIASQAAVAIDNARLLLEAQDKAVLEERTRLAHDLHDSATQTVFSLGMLAGAARAQLEQGSPKLTGTLDRVATLAQEALVEMRSLLFELRPDALADGLSAALPKLAAGFETRTNIAVRCTGNVTARLTPGAEMAVFRIVQETLGNVAKHARATAVVLQLTDTDGILSVTVKDNGLGFDLAAPVTPTADGKTGGQGLRSMRERAAAAGLLLRIASAIGAGTTVQIEAPVLKEVQYGPIE